MNTDFVYRSPLFRAGMRLVRSATAVGVSAFIGAIIGAEDADLAAFIAIATPSLLALDKYVRAKLADG